MAEFAKMKVSKGRWKLMDGISEAQGVVKVEVGDGVRKIVDGVVKRVWAYVESLELWREVVHGIVEIVVQV